MKKILLFLLVCSTLSICSALELYRSSAVASYYGADFHGKKTSNGEMFDMNDFTCANKELPFETILKVTNLSNGKSVQVRVNDRGPFVVGREIDLSTAAAKKLDMIKTGTAKVRIEIVKKGSNTKQSVATAASAKKIMEKISGGQSASEKQKVQKTQRTVQTRQQAPQKKVEEKIWDIQLAAFSSRANAERFATELYNEGFENITYQTTEDVVRVVISRVPSSELDDMQDLLKAYGHKDFVVRQRKN